MVTFQRGWKSGEDLLNIPMAVTFAGIDFSGNIQYEMRYPEQMKEIQE